MPTGVGPSPAFGQYYSASLNNGQMFRGGNQAAVATAFAAGLPTTYTGGLILANPIGNAKKIILIKAKASFVLAQTNVALIGLGVGYSATALTGTLTAVPIQNTLVAGAPAVPNASTALLVSSASVTLPTAPYLAAHLGTVDTGATTTAVAGGELEAAFDGSIVLGPGGFVCFTSSAAGTASSFLGAFTWVEA